MSDAQAAIKAANLAVIDQIKALESSAFGEITIRLFKQNGQFSAIETEKKSREHLTRKKKTP